MKPLCTAKQPRLSFLPARWNLKRQRDSGFHKLNGYRRGGLRGAGGISTDPSIAANIDRGCCPKNRSAAVVPSARVRKKLWIAVRHVRFLGWSSPRSAWFRNERYPLRPSTLELERWNTSASLVASALSWLCSARGKWLNAPPGSKSGARRRSASARSDSPWVTVRVEATRSR